MRHLLRTSSALALVALAVVAPSFSAAAPVAAQQNRTRRAELPSEEIIRRFAASESQLREARNNYTFKQDVLMETIGPGKVPTGRYRRVSEIIFNDRSERVEKITFFPQSTLTGLVITQEDLSDLGLIQPFALTTEELHKYYVRAMGTERIDDVDTYIFDVSPKDPRGLAKTGQRYFVGRVWVEDQDYMIVKVAGKAGPEIGNNRYPRFETYRENIDGKYWFPTYTYADDVLQFENGNIHMRMVVRYADYRQYTGTITVEEGSEEPDTSTPPEGTDEP